jgi:hypothetical protein
MVTRGFGDISVSQITLTGDRWPNGASLHEALDDQDLNQAWNTYLDEVTV